MKTETVQGQKLYKFCWSTEDDSSYMDFVLTEDDLRELKQALEEV